MYGVVLMVALTGGADVPATGFGGCHGCGGCYGCGGGGHRLFSGCHGCHGCGGGLFKGHGCHGCCGGGHKLFGGHRCHGCSGCYGYSCGGGCYGYSCGGGCYGYSCNGCSGGMVASGCCGGAAATTTTETKKEEGTKKENDDAPLTAEEQKKWSDYINDPELDAATKKEALKLWNDATTNKAKRELLKSLDEEARVPAAPARLIVNLPASATLTIQGAATSATSTKRVFVSPALQIGQVYQYNLEARVVQDGRTIVVKKAVQVRAGRATEVSLTVPAPSVARGN